MPPLQVTISCTKQTTDYVIHLRCKGTKKMWILQMKSTKKYKNKHKNTTKWTHKTKHTSTLPHYHIKKCVEYLYMSKKSSNFANKLVVESIFEYNRQYMLNIYAKAYIGRWGRTNAKDEVAKVKSGGRPLAQANKQKERKYSKRERVVPLRDFMRLYATIRS